MGLALLYAYRSQSVPVPEVDISQAQQDINAGRIRSVTIIANKATLQFKDTDTHKEQTTVPEPDTILSKTVQDYNNTHADQVALKFQENNNSLSIVGSILLSLLPVLLIGGFFFYMMRQAQGTNNQALSFGKSRARMFIGNKPT
ncbi:MAG: cell division protein FtsH, partial [Chloroflexota bacterium]